MLMSDLIAYGCELVIVVAAYLLLQYPNSQHLQQTFMACYYIDIFAVLVPDVLHLLFVGWQWMQQRRAASAAGAEEDSLHDRQASSTKEHDSLAHCDRPPDEAADAAAAAALRLTADGRVQQ